MSESIIDSMMTTIERHVLPLLRKSKQETFTVGFKTGVEGTIVRLHQLMHDAINIKDGSIDFSKFSHELCKAAHEAEQHAQEQPLLAFLKKYPSKMPEKEREEFIKQRIKEGKEAEARIALRGMAQFIKHVQDLQEKDDDRPPIDKLLEKFKREAEK